ncbi:MAG: LPS export ABC transporter ATP-binding protein [Candidatus Lindowbacteria bacterium RIFCSPLOWO2_12_FULL_62_27]|nr:MAG: LPS export ABC transporter ATP-binding protein [Candidatus Lindowbacteria bacterium RIFCSPLOWO2_02_FULL_62_12]OGH61394.1 MAG: LPS export ABC transporter ATP-binding protein [Candidatus Lindowbacteria bacterium RIFCSPLOWO2_12_FULL_62_27]
MADAQNGQGLQVEGLTKRYQRRYVVRDVGLAVHPSQIVGLLGPNGAGKTTTFKMLVGLVRPTTGRVLFGGADITSYPMYRRARCGIGYLPQEPSVFRGLTVEDNLMAILELGGGTKAGRKERLDQMIERFDLKLVRKTFGENLSGGERRRVEIARALIPNPKVLLLDEPFAGIDPIAVSTIQDIVLELREEGYGILITDHNVRETLSITQYAYIVYDGRVLTAGSSADLIEDDRVRGVYLGERFRLD